jgi:hypothetical protein
MQGVRPAAWVVLAFMVLAGVYAAVNPLFEAPDERYHFAFVDHLARGGGLPDQRERGPWFQEGSQPPLFYMAAAVVVAPFEYPYERMLTLIAPNGHARLGNGSEPHLRNRNAVVHDGAYPPLDTARFAAYVARYLNIAFAAVAVWCVYRAGLTVLGSQRAALGMMMLTAFNPQFAFISGAINNDALATLWGSLILWQTFALLRDGFTVRRSVVLAVAVALATLTKVSGLLFGGVVGLAALWVLVRTRDWRGFWTLAALGVGVWLAVAGWWYARNLSLYGEFTGTQQMIQVIGSRPAPPLSALLVELTSLPYSFFGVFGWFNILTPTWFYTLVDVGIIVAGFGLLWRLGGWRADPPALRAQIGLAALTALAGIIAIVAWTSQTHGTQGRLLFPYIAAWSLLLVIGWMRLRVPVRAVAVGLGACALAFPFMVIAPMYATPAPLTEPPAEMVPLYARWDDVVELVGHAPVNVTARTGDLVEVTLVWRALRRTQDPVSIYLHLIGPDGSIIGQVDSYPHGGMRSTTLWTPDRFYADTHVIRITQPIPAGEYPLTLQFGWYEMRSGQRLTTYDPQGGQPDAARIPLGRLVSP